MQRHFVGTLVCILLWAASAAAQIPRTFSNLEVLPKDISPQELIGTMRNIAGSLGVRCTHCHVGPDNLQGMDFATDQKETKRVARVMLRMVREMNSQFVAKLPVGASPRQPVSCAMCHRRADKPPKPLHELLLATLSARGADAAAKEYRAIRAEHLGSGLYDFREPTLNIAARRLLEEKKFDDALVLLRLNAEFYPTSADVQVSLGEASMRKGDLAAAESYFKRALEMQPGHKWATDALQQMKAKREEKK